jgi:hypothetical protein
MNHISHKKAQKSQNRKPKIKLLAPRLRDRF